MSDTALVMMTVGAIALYDAIADKRIIRTRITRVIESDYYKLLFVIVVLLMIHNTTTNNSVKQLTAAISVLIALSAAVGRKRERKNG